MPSILPLPVDVTIISTTTHCGLGDDVPSPSFQILALDGGGFRGLFTAVVLDHWERQLRRPIVDHFDLIVGTSTGGIIALGKR